MLTVIKFPYLKFTLVPNVRTWCHLFQVYRDLLGFATKQESTLAQPKVNSKKIHIRKWESNGIHICNTLCKRIYMVRCMTYKLQIFCNFIIALTIPCERIILLNYKFVRPLFFSNSLHQWATFFSFRTVIKSSPFSHFSSIHCNRNLLIQFLILCRGVSFAATYALPRFSSGKIQFQMNLPQTLPFIAIEFEQRSNAMLSAV